MHRGRHARACDARSTYQGKPTQRRAASLKQGPRLIGLFVPCYDFPMPYSTPAGERVFKVVDRWMRLHSELPGIWDVFEGSRSFDIIVSVGGRRLTLIDEQGGAALKPEVEQEILDWLNDITRQVAIT